MTADEARRIAASLMPIGPKSTNFGMPTKTAERRLKQLWINWPMTLSGIGVIGAFFPDMVREMIRDQMADAGLTEEDIRELLQKAEQELEGSKSTKH